MSSHLHWFVWGHIIGIDASESQVFALLQFFIGPGAIPPPWIVRLGRRPSGSPPDFAVRYYARYLEQPAPDGRTGEFLRLVRGRCGPLGVQNVWTTDSVRHPTNAIRLAGLLAEVVSANRARGAGSS